MPLFPHKNTYKNLPIIPEQALPSTPPPTPPPPPSPQLCELSPHLLSLVSMKRKCSSYFPSADSEVVAYSNLWKNSFLQIEKLQPTLMISSVACHHLPLLLVTSLRALYILPTVHQGRRVFAPNLSHARRRFPSRL